MSNRYINSITYKPSQQVESVAIHNGVTETLGYSSDRLQLTSQTVTNGSSTFASLGYNYVADQTRNGGTQSGNSGQLMNITATIVDETTSSRQRDEAYSYDGVGRLVTASGWNSNWARRYDYDRWGNRTAVWNATTGGSQLQSLDLQAPGGVKNNRLNSVTANGTVYAQSYDYNGNITNDGIHAYQYDAENRVVRIDAGLTNDATFVYDWTNRRVKRVEQGYTTYFVWEGSSVIAEYSNRPQTSPGGRKFYHSDQLSNRLVTDNSGVVKGASDILPFGDEGGRSGESEKHRFTSYERDRESGTDYAVNRRYSQVTGRFNRPDPFGGSAGSPQSVNRYSYVGNDPTNATDPSGLFDPAFAAHFSKLAENFGYRVGDLPGFGTEWGSLLDLDLWRHTVIIRTGFDPAFPNNSNVDIDPSNLVGPQVSADQQLVWDVAWEAGELLNNRDCAQYLGGIRIPGSQLKTTFQKMSELGNVRATRNQKEVGYGPQGQPAVASTEPGMTPHTTILRFGPIFLNLGRVGGAADYFANSGAKNLTRPGLQLVMLHELGHAAGSLNAIHGGPNTTEEYNRGILRNCFGIK